MGVIFHWFKDIRVRIECEPYIYSYAKIDYIDGDCTSHSYHNRSKLQDLFMKKCGIYISTINEYGIESDNYEFDLIEPNKMVEYCETILSDKECDVCGLRDRLNWIKSLSMQGYYVAYESE